MMTKDRRTVQRIYYDMLKVIQNYPRELKPTTIQLRSKLSFDKVKNHLKNLQEYRLINSNYTITQKGMGYMIEYEELLTKSQIVYDVYLTPTDLKMGIPKKVDKLDKVLETLSIMEQQMRVFLKSEKVLMK